MNLKILTFMNIYISQRKNCLTMEQYCDTEDKNWQWQQTNAGSFSQKQPVLTSFAVTGDQITNWYELQQRCHVCSGNQQEHNASSLSSVKVKEWHRPYWPWIRNHSSLSHTSSLMPCHQLHNTHTHKHAHFKHFRIKALDGIDCMQG